MPFPENHAEGQGRFASSFYTGYWSTGLDLGFDTDGHDQFVGVTKFEGAWDSSVGVRTANTDCQVPDDVSAKEFRGVVPMNKCTSLSSRRGPQGKCNYYKYTCGSTAEKYLHMNTYDDDACSILSDFSTITTCFANGNPEATECNLAYDRPVSTADSATTCITESFDIPIDGTETNDSKIQGLTGRVYQAKEIAYCSGSPDCDGLQKKIGHNFAGPVEGLGPIYAPLSPESVVDQSVKFASECDNPMTAEAAGAFLMFDDA